MSIKMFDQWAHDNENSTLVKIALKQKKKYVLEKNIIYLCIKVYYFIKIFLKCVVFSTQMCHIHN